MKIRADLLKISSNGRNEDGSLAEPEQQQVQRVLTTEVPLGPQGGAAIGAVPAEIVTYSSAIAVAGALSRQCGNCKFFDQATFQQTIAAADHPLAPMENRRAVNEIRAGLLQSGNAGLTGEDVDPEQALKECGFCTALSEHYKEPVGVHEKSSCPADVITPSQPAGFFKPLSKKSARVAGSNYDKVMNAAAGKLVTK